MSTDPSEDFESHRHAHEPPAEDRPNWLVGAEEGARAESERPDAPAPVPLRLVKPAGEAPPAQKKAKPEAWKAAASSVPRLQHVDAADDDQPIVTHRSQEPRWAEPAGSRGRPELAADPDLVDDLAADPLDPSPVRAAPAAPVPVLNEPWWAIALDALQTSRPLQIGLAAAVIAAVAWMMWPRSDNTVPISDIRNHPERFSGATVRVQGKVGDVYEVGGAHAFYLVQGGDTIVVFSRVRAPLRNERVRVSGSVSMGYMDGVARPALFEIIE